MATRISHNDYLKKCFEKYGNIYSYEKTKYVNRRSKITIGCSKHGDFIQEAGSHLYNRKGCPKCGLEKISDKVRLSNSEFVLKAKKEHGFEKYDYSLVVYKGAKIDVEIICKKHGSFFQKPNYHLSGNGCPKCSESKGEIKISEFLKRENIEYVRQKKFVSCRNKKELPFDFYIPSKNILIEFDGQQHEKDIDFFSKKYSHSLLKRNDEIKNKFAKQNNFKLLRISYKQYNNVDVVLKENI
jgi:Zn finger protein HypA/HybF involved in hydrogenase expression